MVRVVPGFVCEMVRGIAGIGSDLFLLLRCGELIVRQFGAL